jgi:Ca-activated chloride channel homolog
VRFGAGIVLGMLLALGLLWSTPARALDFDWLRSENRHVREGNQRLQAGDTKGALAEYDSAAQELPSEGGVHLDRGLALLRAGELGPAREALRLGTQPAASAAVRADAFYNLGIGFYREADARAGENKHDEAQQLFKEAADAFKQSLRLRAGDPNSAWNYELARRRVTEQQEKQKQDEQKQDEQKQDEQKQDEQKQDEQKPDQEQGDDKQDQPKPDQPQDEQAKKPDSPEPQPKPEQKPDGKQDGQDAQQPPPTAQEPPAVPPEVNRALDALDNGENNLERVRALNRAARERRKPEKDW